MSWKPKFFILYTEQTFDLINWPSKWRNTCRANLPSMLQEVLNVSTIGSEIKLIWNDEHRRIVMSKNKVTYSQLEKYLKARTCMLSFTSVGTRKRAADALRGMGAGELIFVDCYRDVIVYQAYFKEHARWPSTDEAIAYAGTGKEVENQPIS